MSQHSAKSSPRRWNTESSDARRWSSDDSDGEGSAIDSRHAACHIPKHVYDLVAALSPAAADLHLENEADVVQFTNTKRTADARQQVIQNVSRLVQLQSLMMCSNVFTTSEVQLVSVAIDDMVKPFSSAVQRDIMGRARQDYRQQVVANAVDLLLLDPESLLFKQLIRQLSVS